MEIHRSTVILLLLLSVLSFTHGQPAYIRARYQKFLNQHLAPYVNREMCTDVIRNRNIGSETGECKPVNTFIQANENEITAVCARNNRLNYNLFQNNQPFSLVTCRLQSGQWPNCEYDTGWLSTRYIVLACEQGWPVHYERSTVQMNIGWIEPHRSLQYFVHFSFSVFLYFSTAKNNKN